MAGVSINTGSADYRDELSKVSEDQWNAIFSQRRLYIHTEFEHGCECVINWLAEAEEFYERLGFESADQMLLEKLEIPPDWVRMAAAVLEASGENLSKPEVDNAIELLKRGRPKKKVAAEGDPRHLDRVRGARAGRHRTHERFVAVAQVGVDHVEVALGDRDIHRFAHGAPRVVQIGRHVGEPDEVLEVSQGGVPAARVEVVDER